MAFPGDFKVKLVKSFNYTLFSERKWRNQLELTYSNAGESGQRWQLSLNDLSIPHGHML